MFKALVLSAVAAATASVAAAEDAGEPWYCHGTLLFLVEKVVQWMF